MIHEQIIQFPLYRYHKKIKWQVKRGGVLVDVLSIIQSESWLLTKAILGLLKPRNLKCCVVSCTFVTEVTDATNFSYSYLSVEICKEVAVSFRLRGAAGAKGGRQTFSSTLSPNTHNLEKLLNSLDAQNKGENVLKKHRAADLLLACAKCISPHSRARRLVSRAVSQPTAKTFRPECPYFLNSSDNTWLAEDGFVFLSSFYPISKLMKILAKMKQGC